MKMMKTLAAGLAIFAAVACGKKKEEETTSTQPVGTVQLTCSGKACVGTEGQ